MMNQFLALMDVGVPSGPIVAGLGIVIGALVLLLPVVIAFIVIYYIRKK